MPLRRRSIISREYRIFREEEQLASLPRSLYERLCIRAERLNIKPGAKAAAKLQDSIDFCHLNVTPAGVTSLAVLFMLATVVPALLAILFFKALGTGLLVILIALFLTYYLYSYPKHLARRYRVEAGSDLVVMVLYMAMYMRNAPNLEGAVRFTSENIPGFLGFELKKMLWDVEVGNYLSMQEALIAYTKRWEANREFVEAIELLITSLSQTGSKRIELLDEAVTIMLDGTKEQAKHFNQQLKLPVMVVHALGIVLPIMGLVMFPVIALFLNVDASILFIVYDIILPVVLYFVIKRILELRPATFSRIDISENPDVPPAGRFRTGTRTVAAWPIAVVAGAAFIALGVVLINAELAASARDGTPFQGIFGGLVAMFGLALGIGIYHILLAKDRTKLRSATRKIESEFAESLFQLGNQISGGSPIEVSIERSMSRIENLKIKNLFERALQNMKMLGMTFSQAFFDKERGAIRFFPSRLIKSVMRTVVESTKKGVATAAVAMLSVSRYLKGLHSTQEEVREELSETINALKFQLFFLSPMISAIIVTMAIIIIQILQQLAATTSATTQAAIPFVSAFGAQNITPLHFIIVVGVYLIETSFLIALFTNAIENGEDPIGRADLTGYAMIISFVVFVVIFAVSFMLFKPLIGAVV